ncbi:MAG TPA: SCO family protein [Streptosporangiaceae bacterium]|nr:SCO family protein [Streptosporangiaceae bacterium]
MPGMHSGVDTGNSILVAAFRAALMHQGLIALLIFFALASAWIGVRECLPAAARAGMRRAGQREAAARAVLRIGFGVLWVFDGILQAQPAMPAGLPGQVVAPEAASAPSWVRDLVGWSGTGWTNHPVQASAAAVWIQVGIGVWLLAAASGRWSRAAGIVSAGWSVVVWVFGEAFGGLFSPGQSLLSGAPGAVAFYFVAGCLIALPDQAWQRPALGRRLIAGLGIFLGVMAVLQAWPGRGFWQGINAGRPGPLTDMILSMSSLPQPSLLARVTGDVAAVTVSHGFGVNVLAVVTLAFLSLGLLAGLLAARRRLLRVTVLATAVFCLADWLLVQDLGFFGGLGTDPNSMLPLLLLVTAGYLGLTRATPGTEPDSGLVAQSARTWRDRLRPRSLAGGFASLRATGVLALWGAVVMLLGAAPMAMAEVNPVADPIIAQALDGAGTPLNQDASPFALTDVSGRPVSLASLRGKVVLLTFLDPVRTTDCPLIARELLRADRLLGGRASSVELVAIAASQRYYTAPYLRAFDQRQHLPGVPNWHFLTGPLRSLRTVWDEYGVSARTRPDGTANARNDLVLVIDPRGRLRARLPADPGPGTASTRSSFAAEFARAAAQAMDDAHR